jgi:ribose transport system permease protein
MAARFTNANATLSRFFSNYGMLAVLLLLCAYYSWATLREQQPRGAAAGEALAAQVVDAVAAPSSVLIVARDTDDDRRFVERLEAGLAKGGLTIAGKVLGEPRDARAELTRLAAAGTRFDVIATTPAAARWTVYEKVAEANPALGKPRVMFPVARLWPTFLKGENLLNVANQIVVVALLAVGMTLVIVTGGIDLSVGSLIALSAVVTGLIVRDAFGGAGASGPQLVAAGAAGVAVCAMVGVFSGLLITVFKLPPFIATLGVMQVAGGLAYILSKGASIDQVPDSFTWLGRASAGGIPVAVVLMGVIYLVAHVVMSKTTFGRYVYAVGGNVEAARLAGVRVGLVLVVVYALSGAMAGLGGVVMASQLKSAAPTYGSMYELYVIAAVVVGGASLAGGEGRILGTLIGALIIAVIQNGMNLTGVESYTQKIVLGAVILGAVLLDMLKKHGWRRFIPARARRHRRGGGDASAGGGAGRGTHNERATPATVTSAATPLPDPVVSRLAASAPDDVVVQH